MKKLTLHSRLFAKRLHIPHLARLPSLPLIVLMGMLVLVAGGSAAALTTNEELRIAVVEKVSTLIGHTPEAKEEPTSTDESATDIEPPYPNSSNSPKPGDIISHNSIKDVVQVYGGNLIVSPSVIDVYTNTPPVPVTVSTSDGRAVFSPQIPYNEYRPYGWTLGKADNSKHAVWHMGLEARGMPIGIFTAKIETSYTIGDDKTIIYKGTATVHVHGLPSFSLSLADPTESTISATSPSFSIPIHIDPDYPDNIGAEFTWSADFGLLSGCSAKGYTEYPQYDFVVNCTPSNVPLLANGKYPVTVTVTDAYSTKVMTAYVYVTN